MDGYPDAGPCYGNGPAERVAILELRRLIGGGVGPDLSLHSARLAFGAALAFDAALAEMARKGVRRIQLGTVATVPSKDEHRLLRALAAVQSGDDGLADNYLYKIVLDPDVRRKLAGAVTALAAALARSGHRLGESAPDFPV